MQPGDVFRRPVFVAGADANAAAQEHVVEPRAPAQAQAPVPQQQHHHHAPLAQAQQQAQQQQGGQQQQQQQQQPQQGPPPPQVPQQVSQPQPTADNLPRLHVNVNMAGAPQQAPVPHQVASSFPQQGVMFPDIALFGQLDQAVPRISLVHPLHVQQGAATNAAPPPQPDRRQAASQAPPAAQAGGGTGGKTRSQSDYASRHQAAEQRRRTRINERLERLRTIVPHAERSNTATFLEQVYAHIEHLNDTISTLKEGIVVRESRIQELMASGRPENTPQPIPESSKDPVNRADASQVAMKEDPGVETGDVGVQANTVAETALPPVGEQWIGIKDGLKRSPIHTIQDPAKRLRA